MINCNESHGLYARGVPSVYSTGTPIVRAPFDTSVTSTAVVTFLILIVYLFELFPTVLVTVVFVTSQMRDGVVRLKV